jgi:hypothetical protein
VPTQPGRSKSFARFCESIFGLLLEADVSSVSNSPDLACDHTSEDLGPAQNNGVLIYLLLADQDVEIVADRGIDAHVGAKGWERICQDMENDFRSGHFEVGVIKGIASVSRELAKYFPPDTSGRNELPDKPVVI